ncbi:MAG TPA: LysR family transcriptional regulator [Marinobacterium sp.]|nr:LysR family transcriptional regulator [Marinobacterium sp.]
MLRLRGVDLNLLVVFRLLYEHRNTGVVADKLGITQPAVSNCLARLRKQLKDELFERTQTGLTPTPYADRIFEVVQFGLMKLEEGLGETEKFDPRTSDRIFTVAMSEMKEAEILPSLYSYICKHAPNVGIKCIGDVGLELKTGLESGEIDLAIGYFPQLQAGFYQRRLYEEPYVCLLRTDHQMLNGPLTPHRLAGFDHLIIEAPSTGHSHVEKMLREAGIFHTRGIHIPNFLSAPYIVRESDLIVSLPQRFALMAANALGLATIPHPVLIEPSWVRLFWHRRFHKDEGLAWLRGVMVELRGDEVAFSDGLGTRQADLAVLNSH